MIVILRRMGGSLDVKSTLSNAKSSLIVGGSSHHKQNTSAQEEENCLRPEYVWHTSSPICMEHRCHRLNITLRSTVERAIFVSE